LGAIVVPVELLHCLLARRKQIDGRSILARY